MLLKPLAMIAALATTVRSQFVECTQKSTEEESKFLRELAAEAQGHGQYGTIRARQNKMPGPVNVYMHVIADGPTVKEGYATRDTMNEQFQLLSKGFAASGITFHLADIDWTINQTWASNLPENQYPNPDPMRKKLRKGTYADLNLYYMSSYAVGNPNATGTCWYPLRTAPARTSGEFIRDGCSMRSETLPGSPCQVKGHCYLGVTTTHEVGHWFGLQHTHQDGCTDPGDGIDDTPAHLYNSTLRGCPPDNTRNTCTPDVKGAPFDTGFDPIHNFMSYMNDTCRNEFTAGQKTVMVSNFLKLRDGK